MADECWSLLVVGMGVWWEAQTKGYYAYSLEYTVVDGKKGCTEASSRFCWDEESLCDHCE